MKHAKKVFLGLTLLVAAVVAVPVGAQAPTPAGGSGDPRDDDSFQLVPCTGVAERDDKGAVISGKDCDFNALVEMANRVIQFSLYLSVPFVLCIIMYTAFQYLTSNGNPVKLDKAKHMVKYVVIGLLWILGSFILVYTVLDKLLDGQIKTDQQSIWNSYFKQ